MIELLLEAERARSSGQIERAEQLYRQVAQADPHNAIAVVGLALLALDRGDDLGAYLLARRALTIDPEDEAARRLAARLEGGLAARGTPVADPMPTAAPVPMASLASPDATARAITDAIAPPAVPEPGPETATGAPIAPSSALPEAGSPEPGRPAPPVLSPVSPDPSAGTARPSTDVPPAAPPKRGRSILDRLLGRGR